MKVETFCERKTRLLQRKLTLRTPRRHIGWHAVTQHQRPRRSTTEPRPLWQRVIAGERLPKALFRHPKCEGTIEDHRAIALDVRELIRLRVFEQPVGRVSNLDLTFPWLRVMRLNSSSLELQLVTGRIVVVPLVWANCGVVGKRLRLECPLCGRRLCALYHLDGRVACRCCNGLWYAAQRTSTDGRKFLAKRKIRRKLGDYGQLWAAQYPPKPRGMWRRTYAPYCAALDRIERTKLTPRRMSANAPRAAVRRTFRNRR
jgi:hypothetical protein